MKNLFNLLFILYNINNCLAIPSNEEVQHYILLKQLRNQGYTCPNGVYYPPNPNIFAFDCRIWTAAHSYANNMAINNFFSHIDPKTNQNPCDRTNAVGLQACKENIAAGQSTPQSALDALKASVEHCPNMMDPKINRIGIGYAYNLAATYRYFWVQNMGTDIYRADTSCNPPNPGDTANLTYLPSGACRDLNLDTCPQYKGFAGTSACADPWPKSQCQLTCGWCTTITTTAPIAPIAPTVCIDNDPINCKAYIGYAGTQYCGPNYGNGWAFTNCKKTCKLC
jgi:hypothetical protein